MLHLQLPAHATSTPTALRLWVIQHTKTTPDKLRRKVDSRTCDKRHGDGIKGYVGGLDMWVGEYAACVELVGCCC